MNIHKQKLIVVLNEAFEKGKVAGMFMETISHLPDRPWTYYNKQKKYQEDQYNCVVRLANVWDEELQDEGLL